MQIRPSGSQRTQSSAAPLLNSADRYAHIDAMRAVAVMIVVTSHAGLGAIVPGNSGVTIFFAISGYIITTLLLRERDRAGGFDVRGFYFRRFAKLAPPFAVFVLLPSLIGITLGMDVLAGLLSQTFFAYNWALLLSDPLVFPGTAVTWSLAIEEQFYIVFALAWLIVVRSRHWEALTAASAAVVVVASFAERAVLAVDSASYDRIHFGTDTRMDAIALGVLLAVILRRTLAAPDRRAARALGSRWMLIGAIALFAISLLVRDEYFRNTVRYSLQALAACGVIAWGFGPMAQRPRGVLNKVIRAQAVQYLGLASYSIYLAHLVVIVLLAPSVSTLPAPLRSSLLIAAGTAVGCLCYQFVERPVQRRIKSRRSGSAKH